MNLSLTGLCLPVTAGNASGSTFAAQAGRGTIHGEFASPSANLLETGCSGFHTPATEFEACRSMRQRIRPVSSAEPRGADDIAAGGTERAFASIMNVSLAVGGAERYPSSESGNRPEYWPDPGTALTSCTVTGHSTIDAPMNAVSENIHATPPQFAAVAPILHLDTQVTANGRTTTPNNGAADAGGR